MLFPAGATQDLRRYALVIGLIAACLFGLSAAYYSYLGVLSVHLGFLHLIQEGKYLAVLHPGVYWLTLLVSGVSGLAVYTSMNLLLSLHVVLGFFAAMWALKLMTSSRMEAGLCVAMGLALLFVAPVGIPYLMDARIYDFARHNRSILMLRNSTAIALLPYGLAAMGLLGCVLNNHQRGALLPFPRAALASVFLFVSCLMKPTLGISLIPAIGLYVLFSKRFDRDDVFVTAVMLAPAALLIVAQFVIGFVYNPLSPTTIHVVFKPMSVWFRNNKYPLVELLLAVLFPLLVSVWRRRALSSFTVICWINLAIALVPYILLDEVAEISTSYDRDFEWSYVVGKQALFLCGMIEWWRWRNEDEQAGSKEKKLLKAAGILLVLHALFGVARFPFVDAVPVGRNSAMAKRYQVLPLNGDEARSAEAAQNGAANEEEGGEEQ